MRWVTPLIVRDQIDIIQNLQMSPISQTSFFDVTLFAASYSKAALVVGEGIAHSAN